MDLISKKTVLKTWPFTVEEMELGFEGKPFSQPYHRLVCPDWTNILPVTTDGKAVLIRQPRAGSLSMVLETPGGCVDSGEKDVMMAALRELEEETGYTSMRVLPLGSLNPNPAIMSNKCHFFLGLACQPAPNRQHFPDAEERINVELVDVQQLDALVRTGAVDHGLSALCILLAAKYLKDQG